MRDKPPTLVKKWSLGLSLWEVGMQYGVWRRDIEAYIAVFPVRVMAEQWMRDCSYPEHSEIHDFHAESATPKIKGFRKLRLAEPKPLRKKQEVRKVIEDFSPPNPRGYSKSYFDKVIKPLHEHHLPQVQNQDTSQTGRANGKHQERGQSKSGSAERPTPKT